MLITFAAVCNTVPRYLDFDPPYDCDRFITNYKLYSTGQAISFSLLILAAIMRRTSDKVVEIILTAVFWCSISNLMDELFFDPIHFGYNELVFAVLMMIHATYQYTQYRKNAYTHAGKHIRRT